MRYWMAFISLLKESRIEPENLREIPRSIFDMLILESSPTEYVLDASQYVENYGPGGIIRRMDNMNTFFFLLEAEDDE